MSAANERVLKVMARRWEEGKEKRKVDDQRKADDERKAADERRKAADSGEELWEERWPGKMVFTEEEWRDTYWVGVESGILEYYECAELLDQSVCPIVDQVRELLRVRAGHGLAKYGVDMTRKDKSKKDWLRAAQEEALDLAVYLQRLIVDEH